MVISLLYAILPATSCFVMQYAAILVVDVYLDACPAYNHSRGAHIPRTTTATLRCPRCTAALRARAAPRCCTALPRAATRALPSFAHAAAAARGAPFARVAFPDAHRASVAPHHHRAAARWTDLPRVLAVPLPR